MTDILRASTALDGCVDACERCIRLVDDLEHGLGETATPDETSRFLGHLRHCIDHFQCFFHGLDAGTVDYDARQRDPHLESSYGAMRDAFASTVARFRTFPVNGVSDSVVVRQSVAPGASPSLLHSTVERELAFLSSHAIHHLALVVQLARAAGVAVDEELGVAYSTAAYRKTTATTE